MRKLASFVLIALMFAISVSARVSTETSAGAAQTAKVTIKNFEFVPKELTVTAGATVEWVNEGGRHTVEADKNEFKSDVLANGGKFSHKFDKPGTYAYHCGFHGSAGGKDMAGKIIVKK
ncbi:MAG: cupredoxin domain-containing protein [Acidobacteriota bacterium]